MDKTTPMKAKPLVNVTCKLGAKSCFEDGRCHALGRCENKIETNADKIRNMNDEELADFLEEFEACDVCKYLDNNRCTFENPCVHEFAGAIIYEWLQSEVKGSDV